MVKVCSPSLSSPFLISLCSYLFRDVELTFSQGATYDAIEGRFRHIRRQAAQMVEEVNSGARPAAPARGNGNASTNSTANNSFAAEGDGGTLPTTPKKSKGTKTPGSTPRGGKKVSSTFSLSGLRMLNDRRMFRGRKFLLVVSTRTRPTPAPVLRRVARME